MSIHLTAKQNTSDIAETLEEMGFVLTSQDGLKARYVLVTCEAFNCRFGYTGLDKDTGPLFLVGGALELENWDDINNTTFISAITGKHATLHANIKF